MTEENLRELVCTLGRIDSGKLTAETSLAYVIDNSLGMAKLDASLRSKFSISNPGIYKTATYGELCGVLGIGYAPGTPSPASPLRSVGVQGMSSGISVGVDVGSIAEMPLPADYWEDDFYKMTFTAQEIGYALLQPSPQASFAAMWCAKEAVRKADASLTQVNWKTLEVVHDAQGKPSISVDGKPTLGSLSLSHTDEIAFAVFAAVAQRSVSVASPADSILKQQTEGPRHNSKITILTAAFALLFSIVALALAFLRH